VHQVDALSFRERWLRADLTESELRRRLAVAPVVPAAHTPPLDLRREISSAIYHHQLERPDLDPAVAEREVRTGVARRLFAEALAAQASTPADHPILVKARNGVALAALDGLGPSLPVALCWGFAHGPDFVEELSRRGYAIEEITWHRTFSW
jgi:hypothetical protein